MYLPKCVLDLLLPREGKIPPYAVSTISKDEARKAFSAVALDGFDITDQLKAIEASKTIYRLKEEGGFQTEVLYNEAGSILLLQGTKPL